MPESPAQRAARERNLRKGNPAAYKGGSQGGSQGEPPAEPPAEPGEESTTFRARSAPAAKARKPKKRRVPPRAPAAEPAPPPAEKKSGGGFLSGLLEGFGG